MDVKVCSKCLSQKPLDLFDKTTKGSFGRHCWCKACGKAYREARKQVKASYDTQHYQVNAEEKNAYQREYSKANREKVLANKKKYHSKPEIREKRKQYRKARLAKAEVRIRRRAANALRKANKINATPKWANPVDIKEFYETAINLSMLLGEWYHVDHIVPLRSDLVCGLHCGANLQVITAEVNLSKGNRYWPDMWV